MARIKTACPHCFARLVMKDSQIGRNLLCPSCTRYFEPAHPQPQTKSSPRNLLVLMGGAGLGLVLLLVLLVVLLIPKSPRKSDESVTQRSQSANARGTGASEVPDGVAGTGKRYALLVGVRDYAHLPHLLYTENDVNELAGVLRPVGYDITLLTTSAGAERQELQPTAANIKAEFKRLANLCGKNDLLLLAFAGHGTQGHEDKDCYFCPAEANPEKADTLVSLTQIYAQMQQSRAGARLLLVDACRNQGRGATEGLNGRNAPHPPRGTAAMFSCSPGQQAFESAKLGKGHGIFFHFVLEGLRGEAMNVEGQVSWDSLSDYVKRQVSRQVPTIVGGGARQTPHGVADLMGESPVMIPGQRDFPLPKTRPKENSDDDPPKREETPKTPPESNPKEEKPGEQVQYLSDMQEFDIKVTGDRFAKKGNLGYGEGDARYAFGKITVNGEKSPNGLSMNPDSNTYARVKYSLPKSAQTFLASAALNDSAGAAGRPVGVGKIPTPLTFQVLGDGKVLWSSKPIDIARVVEECKVDIQGVKVLELRINCPGSYVNAQAVWVEPRVLLK